MHEKVKYLFAQKTQRQNKLPLTLLRLLLQIIFNINFSIRIFTINVLKNFTLQVISCSFSLSVTFTTFCNIYLRARILYKISEPLIPEFFELSRSLLIQ